MNGDVAEEEVVRRVAQAICEEMNVVSGTGQFHDCERLARVAIAAIPSCRPKPFLQASGIGGSQGSAG